MITAAVIIIVCVAGIALLAWVAGSVGDDDSWRE